MSIESWEKISEEHVADMHVFDVVRTVARSPRTGQNRRLSRLLCGDWVNIIALTPAHEVVLVRQYRHGTETITLEIPGGLVDPGETAEGAAVRELREETGYTGGPVTYLGAVEPNPALFNNRCHSYLVENCSCTHELALDPGEDIQVETVPLARVPALTAAGDIGHALVVSGFWWLAVRRPDLFPLA